MTPFIRARPLACRQVKGVPKLGLDAAAAGSLDPPGAIVRALVAGMRSFTVNGIRRLQPPGYNAGRARTLAPRRRGYGLGLSRATAVFSGSLPRANAISKTHGPAALRIRMAMAGSLATAANGGRLDSIDQSRQMSFDHYVAADIEHEERGPTRWFDVPRVSRREAVERHEGINRGSVARSTPRRAPLPAVVRPYRPQVTGLHALACPRSGSGRPFRS